ncbi:MAG: hypothetical protein COV99_01755 [Bacteroidetes bacterium CG12_big_fil_rev_8_21_14_0_65_60_17]|nr:MAG: hypothetical protein COV99_01755 [Bacteroidetes bacterium CG12_big_fil_rev_8_21_14_0_65_60_17]
MAILHPFKALRPVSEKASEVACVPYDVIDSEEARYLAEGKPLSFLHVIRPEIDLPEGTSEYDDAVYALGAENLRSYQHSAFSEQDSEPSVYVYELEMDGRTQSGVFACVSTQDYDQDVILKHERTRLAKEDDRTRHIMEQEAHAEPVMLTYRDDDATLALMAEARRQDPLYNITFDDGVRHTIWRAPDADAFVAAFRDIPRLYVADGHHRCKAASRAAAEIGTADPEARFFPAVLFPLSEVVILPYNRVIHSVPRGPASFLEELKARFDLEPDADPVPVEKGRISLYLDGTWYGMALPAAAPGASLVDHLDVGRLTHALLEPMLGITDPRTDPNIDFVGGIRGTGALEQRVNSGESDMAISMYATDIKELVDVSDAGLLMPPKSTWFEPKLRSGFLVHLFGKKS